MVVIVGASYLVRQKVSDDTVNAMRSVAHTYEVRATASELMASLNEMQAAALATRVNGMPAEQTSSRYTNARQRYPEVLDHLRELTLDSNEQQERIGMLRARIEGRVAALDHAMSLKGDSGLASDELRIAATRFPIDDVIEGFVGHESTLMKSRQADADAQIIEGKWLTLATTLAQMLLLGTVIWVSERQLRRRVTAESETRLAIGRARLIVETVREPIAVITQNLVILQANRAFADFYGAQSPVEGPLVDLQGWGDDRGLHQKLRDVSLTRRELWDYETVQQTQAGEARNVIVNARPMALPDMDDTVALLTISDLTARKHSEEQVLELNRQLEGKIAQVTEVNRELEAFSYSVSHDLRAPLRHISGFAEKLKASLGDRADEKMNHYSDVIATSARRMSTLIEDLLSYSRLGKHALRLQPVDMQSLVDEMRAVLMSSVEDRTITWRLAPLPVVVADASMLQLAWQNLLDNAIKYTANTENAVVEIGCDTTDQDRIFWIRDNGAGFDMRYADKLFGVFQRLHKASAFSGTGIGLASVRRIIARHGGRTWAEGVPDQGSTFYFSLPRQNGA